MSVFGKIFNRLTWHCLGSLGLGVIAAAVIAVAVLQAAGEGENTSTAGTYIIRIPRDEALLRQLSDEILEGTDVAGEEPELMDIAPAAGGEALAPIIPAATDRPGNP